MYFTCYMICILIHEVTHLTQICLQTGSAFSVHFNNCRIISSHIYQVRGLPTIKLFKAGDNAAVDYAGGRMLEDFVKFLTPEAEKAAKDEL